MPFPEDFKLRIRALLGDTEYTKLERALQDDAPASIRLNRLKGTPAPAGERVAWCESGYYLPVRPPFTFDPLFHAGSYYVQEAASMFVGHAVRTHIREAVTALDLCAAPGGKSTLLLDTLPEGSVLVSNEVIRSRACVLAENMAKWGHPDCLVTNNDPEEIGRFRHTFDLVVADVPCSGEGMFRKDSGSTGEWSVANVQLCAARGRRIIHDVWDALRPGGILVYSTCTYNTEEDEDNIHYIIEVLGAEALAVPTLPEWGVTGALKYTYPAYRFFPHKTRGEGFFLAVLRKAGDGIETPAPTAKGKERKPKGKQPAAFPKGLERLLRCPEKYTPQWADREQTVVRMQSAAVARLAGLFGGKLRLLSAGIEVGEIKGKDLIPAQALAFSTALDRTAFPSLDLPWGDAVRYLRKEALVLPPDTPRGFVLLTYRNVPLGFVKNLGNRSNNLYPQEWRIRSGYLPEKEVSVIF